jgi:hypothetical protein
MVRYQHCFNGGRRCGEAAKASGSPWRPGLKPLRADNSMARLPFAAQDQKACPDASATNCGAIKLNASAGTACCAPTESWYGKTWPGLLVALMSCALQRKSIKSRRDASAAKGEGRPDHSGWAARQRAQQAAPLQDLGTAMHVRE